MVKKSLMVFASLFISTSIFCGWITSTVDHTVGRPVDVVTEHGKTRREKRREKRRENRKDKQDKTNKKQQHNDDDMIDNAMDHAGY